VVLLGFKEVYETYSGSCSAASFDISDIEPQVDSHVKMPMPALCSTLSNVQVIRKYRRMQKTG
jgi:hypothetical protein